MLRGLGGHPAHLRGDWDSYQNDYTGLDWTTTDPEKIWNIIYDVPSQADMEEADSLAKARGAGYVFITDAGLPNPYDVLPEASYWDDEQAQVAAGGSPGATPPSVPSGVQATSIGSSQIALSWDGSTPGSQSVAAYDVYQNGDFLTSVPGTSTSYTAVGLQPSTSYGFSVLARDAYGNSSPQSSPLQVETSAAGTAPDAPTNLSAGSTTFTSTTLAWDAPDDPTLAGYNIYENGQEVLSVPSGTTSITVGGLSSGGTSYSFTVQAVDASGAISPQSSTAQASTETLPSGQMITLAAESESASTYYYSAQYLMPFAFRRVYISTGTSPCFWTGSDPQICANYILENDQLYRYSGDGSDWAVSMVADIDPTVEGYETSWSVPAADLGSPFYQNDVFEADGYAPETYGGVLSNESGPTLPLETTGGFNVSEAGECKPCDGDPVNPSTGEYSAISSDIDVPGKGEELELARTYGSETASTLGPFGYGWTDSYEMSIEPDPVLGPSVMDVVQENGSVADFAEQPNGTWLPPGRVFASLVENSGGGWTFTRHDGESFTFNSAGQLISESDLNGETTTLSYTDGLLTTVTDPAGRTLSFTYNGAALVTKVTDSAGRSVMYSYNSSDQLTSVTDVTGGTWQYGYGANNLLTSVTSPDGGVTTNVYDNLGRVVSQTNQLGEKTTWSYDVDPVTQTGTTSVTAPEGIETQYNVTDGDLESETQAYGTSEAATTLYTYDPLTNAIATVVDPDGHETSYTYDPEGDMTSETDPMGRTTTWTYNNWGEVTSETQPASYGGQAVTTTNTYDQPAYSSGGAGNLNYSVDTHPLAKRGARGHTGHPLRPRRRGPPGRRHRDDRP